MRKKPYTKIYIKILCKKLYAKVIRKETYTKYLYEKY